MDADLPAGSAPALTRGGPLAAWVDRASFESRPGRVNRFTPGSVAGSGSLGLSVPLAVQAGGPYGQAGRPLRIPERRVSVLPAKTLQGSPAFGAEPLERLDIGLEDRIGVAVRRDGALDTLLTQQVQGREG